jgi:hypothetical protein
MHIIDSSILGYEKLLCIPNFDLYNLNKVLEFKIRSDPKNGQRDTYEVTLTSLYESSPNEYEITLKLTGACHIKLPDICGSFYFTELEIHDISADLLEGINYRLKDYGTTGFEILSREISITTCKTL